ncbi:hypothetical protein [Kitasatospora sp. NPDC086791]|uniref:hypothetical protein n=1 Tax=Kitasatospora sp. NPDC086791 TaxID=3155178 RepID=UPI0034121AA8
MKPDEAASASYAAQLDVVKSYVESDLTQKKADADFNLSSLQKFHDAYMALAAGMLERRQLSAESVQKAAAAIATIYSGVLAVSFSVAQRPMPASGLLAPIFLALALVLSTIYRSLIEPSDPRIPSPVQDVNPTVTAGNNTNSFMETVMAYIRPGAKVRRAGLASLALGLAFLPVPFISLPGDSNARPGAVVAAWPSPPAADINQVYGAILYKAQVDNAVADSSHERPKDDGWWLLGGIAGGLIIVLVAANADKVRWSAARTPPHGEDEA